MIDMLTILTSTEGAEITASWVSALISIVVSTVVTGIIGYLVKRYLDKYFKKQDDIAKETKQKLDEACVLKEEKQRAANKEDMLEVVNTALGPVNIKIDGMADKLDKVEEGSKSSLRNSICNYYYHCSEKGYRNDLDYENMHKMFDSYTALGGNSFIKDMIHRFDELPTKEEYIREHTKLGHTTKVKKVLAMAEATKEEVIAEYARQNKIDK